VARSFKVREEKNLLRKRVAWITD